MAIRFDERVVIVTGAGNGLGRAHALEFARRGARVVVNDLGGSRDGSGASNDAAEAVATTIRDAGGAAIANSADVTNYEAICDMVDQAVCEWGRVDVLVNNAGILRDKSFVKMDLDDFRLVVDVHLHGAVNCTKAVWPVMREQEFGRIVMTTSSSGLYGNYGQTNYAAAKMSLIGLMNSLTQEGHKYGIRVNAIAPIAATRMTEDLMPAEALAALAPEAVTPAVVFLASDRAPAGEILAAGAGTFSRVAIHESVGIFLPGRQRDAEHIAELWDRIKDTAGQLEPGAASEQTARFLERAAGKKAGDTG